MANAVDKVAIVTGGASGIGLAISQRLARDGAKVAIFDLNEPDAQEAAKAIESDGGTAMAVQCDVSDRAAIARGVAEVRARYGPVTILVNNAGRPGFDRFLDISEETWNGILAVNLTGTFHCCQVVLPDMVEAGWGRIVNVSSSSAQTGVPMMAHYVSSKAGMIGLTKALALEFGPKGITVNTIPPGSIDTPMLRRSTGDGRKGPSIEEIAKTMIPVRRPGQPEDIAAACAYLVSDEAGYVTGQIIGVNGGRVTG